MLISHSLHLNASSQCVRMSGRGLLLSPKFKKWKILFNILVVGGWFGLCGGDGPNCAQKGLGPQDLYQNGVMNTRYSWYRVGSKIQVPVVLDYKYSYRERKIILGGLGEIQEKTCVDFYVFNHTVALQGYDYVYITKSKEGCWSHVGRIGGGQQELSLARGCINHRTAVHEMIHALGFTHEHVRSDRDKYVRIYWGNIQKGRERNFVKRTKGRDAYGPYDYASIMHYDRRAFSVNGEDTIQPLKNPGARIGLGQTMSHWDVERILHMYKCGDGYGGGGYGGGGGGYGYSDGANDLGEYDDLGRGVTVTESLNHSPPPVPHNHHDQTNFHHHPERSSDNGNDFRFSPEDEDHGHTESLPPRNGHNRPRQQRPNSDDYSYRYDYHPQNGPAPAQNYNDIPPHNDAPLYENPENNERALAVVYGRAPGFPQSYDFEYDL